MTKMNLIKVNVVGKGKREIGFVVPGNYDCYTKIKNFVGELVKSLIPDSKVSSSNPPNGHQLSLNANYLKVSISHCYLGSI